MASLGWPLLPPFSWAIKTATTKASEGTARPHVQGMLDETEPFKGQGQVTVNKPFISIIYIVARTWPLYPAQITVDGVESTSKLLPKIHQYLCNRTTYECFVRFSTKLKSPSSK